VQLHHYILLNLVLELLYYNYQVAHKNFHLLYIMHHMCTHISFMMYNYLPQF